MTRATRIALILVLLAGAGCGTNDDGEPNQPAESVLMNVYWSYVSAQVANSLTNQVETGDRPLHDPALDGEGNCFFSADMTPPNTIFDVAQVNGTPGEEGWNLLILEAPRLTQPCAFLEGDGVDSVTIYQITAGIPFNETFGASDFDVTFHVGNQVFAAVYLELEVTSYNEGNQTLVGHFDCLARNVENAEDSRLCVVRNASFLLHTN
jgi:hypothetical protein